MSFLTNLHEAFAVGAKEPSSPDADVRRLSEFARQHGLKLPEGYIDLVREASEIELVVEDRGCVRIWSAAGVVEMNEEYDVQKYLPDALAIGDDEGGKAFAVMDGSHGPGLYRFSFADPDRSEAVFIAASLRALLVEGRGIDNLFDWEE